MNSNNQSTGVLSKEITEVNFINLANNMIGTGLLLTGKANYELAKEYAQQQERVTAIGFTEWVHGRHGDMIKIYAYEGDGVWIIYTPSKEPISPTKITTTELYKKYELYLNQTNQ